MWKKSKKQIVIFKCTSGKHAYLRRRQVPRDTHTYYYVFRGLGSRDTHHRVLDAAPAFLEPIRLV
jgi:hypothetical protein